MKGHSIYKARGASCLVIFFAENVIFAMLVMKTKDASIKLRRSNLHLQRTKYLVIIFPLLMHLSPA